MFMLENDFSKARNAAFALARGWEAHMKDVSDKTHVCLREMRKTCIDVICQTGYADDSVYDSLEKSYIHNVISAEPDFDEIGKTLKALAAINSDKAVRLLYQFLHGLHQKKCGGTWSDTEKIVFSWIINHLAMIKPKFQSVWNLLITIYRSEVYTIEERLSARDTLIEMKEVMKQ